MTEETSTLPEGTYYEYRWIHPPRKWIKKMKYVEPVMFLTTLSGSIFSALQTNAVELQYCEAQLGIYNSTICLNTSGTHFSEIQKFASAFSMSQTIFDSVIPAMASFFLGPWSDIFGRRPLIFSGGFGCFLSFCLWTWGSSTYLNPYIFLSFGLPLSLGGGQMMSILAMFCYVCDVTTLDMRAQRLGILFGALHAGTLVGTLAAPHLMTISYTFAFGVCACMEFIKLAYVYFFLKESVDTSEAQERLISKNPFQWSHVKSLYEVCYIKQTSINFRILFYVSLLVAISMIQAFGQGAVLYLFTQKVLGWTLENYTPLRCTSIISSAYMAFVGTWVLSKVLKLNDLQILAYATGARLFSSLIFAYGRHIWLVYLASVLDSASGLYGPMVRVFLSRIIHVDDLGKVFSLLGSIDSLTPVLSSLIYNTVYNNTIDVYPNAIFLVSGSFCVIMTFAMAKITALYLRPSDELILSPTAASINI